MSSMTLGTWIDAHILVVSLLFVAPLLNGFQRYAFPRIRSISLPFVVRLFCYIVALAFTFMFVKSFGAALVRHSVFPHDGTASWQTWGYVMTGWLWCTFWFWAAILGFIAARKPVEGAAYGEDRR